MYSDKENQKKDMRISWLSIFSSICSMMQGRLSEGADEMDNKTPIIDIIKDQAFKVNKELYSKYPFGELTDIPREVVDGVVEELQQEKIQEIQNKDLPF